MSLAQSTFLGENEIRKLLKDLPEIRSGFSRGILVSGAYLYPKYGIFTGGIGPASYTANPNQIIAQAGEEVVALLDIPSETPIWFYKGDSVVGTPIDADYNWINGHTIVGCTTGIVELDGNGNVVRKFSSSNLGAFNYVYAIRWVPNDVDRVYVCEQRNHIVGKFNLTTGSYEWTFGVFGVAGSDNTHLNYPAGFHPWAGDSVWVADRGNNRVVRVGSTITSISQMLLFSIPNGMDVAMYKYMPALPYPQIHAISMYHSTLNPLTYILEEIDALPELLGIIPMRSEKVRFNPHLSPYKLSWGQSGIIMEEDWRFYTPNKVRMRYSRGAIDVWGIPPISLTANSQLDTGPILGWGHEKQLLRFWSSQPADLYIETPRPKYRANMVPYGFTWKIHDHISLTADSEVGYILTAPPDVWRARVVMGSTNGNVDFSLQGWL